MCGKQNGKGVNNIWGVFSEYVYVISRFNIKETQVRTTYLAIADVKSVYFIWVNETNFNCIS